MNLDKRLSRLEQAAGALLVGCSNCRERKVPEVVIVYEGELAPDFTCQVCGHRRDKPIIVRITYGDMPLTG